MKLNDSVVQDRIYFSLRRGEVAWTAIQNCYECEVVISKDSLEIYLCEEHKSEPLV